jgi:hypothetical protein
MTVPAAGRPGLTLSKRDDDERRPVQILDPDGIVPSLTLVADRAGNDAPDSP